MLKASNRDTPLHLSNDSARIAIPITVMDISNLEIFQAITCAAKGREKRRDFAKILSNRYAYADALLNDLKSNAWHERIHYRVGEVTNTNGKHRVTHQPDCHTLILQHLCKNLLTRVYARHDVGVALNCKNGCGLTAKRKSGSVVHRLKHVFYDHREYNYILKLDQRKCYEHIRVKTVRKALKGLHIPTWLVDMAIALGFVEGKTFPVGTPLSPLLHHIVMLQSDKLLRSLSAHAIRYADDVILFFRTKEEANAAKWRIRFNWWYTLGMRAKRAEIMLQPIEIPIDYCGTVYHRNGTRSTQWNAHNKGYCTIRESTRQRALCSTSKNYPSYFGQIIHTDGFALLTYIEKKMNLAQLTESIRITRHLDAPNIAVKKLADEGIVFVVHDYEIRRDGAGKPNWIKCLISYPDPNNSNKRIMREFHGEYRGIIDFHIMLEEAFTNREFLPITGAKLENACGFIYSASSNMIAEIDDSEIYYT
jgi:hypothetical protein